MAGSEVKALGDRLAGLTAGEASGLAGYLKEAYGIEPAAAAVAPRPIAISFPDVEPSATVDVVLKSVGDKKIQVIRVVRQHTSLGLKEAKDLVDDAPRVMLSGVDRELAEKVRKDLEGQGAAVGLR